MIEIDKEINLEVKEMKYGLAFRRGNTIYIHHKLKYHPQILHRILEHEAHHSPTFYFTYVDLKNDLKEFRIDFQIMWFFLTTPSSWTQLSPFNLVEGKWAIDMLGLIIWILGIIVGGLIALWLNLT